jgi:DNA primase
MSVIDDIKAKIDIVAYIGQYTQLKKAGRTYKGLCVFHAEKTPSMIVDAERQTFKCFGCGKGGDLFTFAQEKHGWTFSEALHELGRQAGVEVRQQTPAQKALATEMEQLHGLLQTAADLYHRCLFNDELPDAVKTLHYARDQRGLSEETLRRFGIGYAPPGWQHMLDYLAQLGYSEAQALKAGLAKKNEQGRVYDVFRNRLMIPIRDERGRVVGFGARALDPDDNPKYLNSPQSPLFDKSKLLFALDLAKPAIREQETVVIVEGYMDAIQAHQAGYTNVVAQMGTALTEAQLRLIAPRLAKKIILALDSDAAGQNATRRSLEVARQTLQADYSGRLAVDIRILQIPGAKDPDDLLREQPQAWQTLIEQAIPVAQYVITLETADLPPNASAQEREAVARRLLPILLASENKIYTNDNLQKLALRLRISEATLLAWAQEQRKIEVANAPRFASTPSEPPPLELDLFEPPFSEGPLAAQAGHDLAKKPTEGQEVEMYCLRLLLRQPELYYHINRAFRVLAAESVDLRQGPLSDLSVDDFNTSDHRALMQIFKVALNQDEQEPLDFLRLNLEGVLVRGLEALLVADLEAVRQRVQHRWVAELAASWKHHEKFIAPSIDASAEVLHCALTLRMLRLQREREQLRFLQMDAGSNEAALDYGRHIMLSMEAKRLIEGELHKYRMSMI